MTAPDMR